LALEKPASINKISSRLINAGFNQEIINRAFTALLTLEVIQDVSRKRSIADPRKRS
jgi:uncharacterized protein Smg (DUF494 family)